MIIFGASFAGCGGGGAELKSHTTTTTLGKEVSVRKSAVGAAVLMSKDQALKMGKYLGDAEKLAALVNDRVRP